MGYTSCTVGPDSLFLAVMVGCVIFSIMVIAFAALIVTRPRSRRPVYQAPKPPVWRSGAGANSHE